MELENLDKARELTIDWDTYSKTGIIKIQDEPARLDTGQRTSRSESKQT